MPRPCNRVRLEQGLKLDLNRMRRRGIIRPGAVAGPIPVRWLHYGEEIHGIITSDMSGIDRGWLYLKLGNLDQRINLTARPRHKGGHQWYFLCPHTGRIASVLWMPPGARSFACRQRWGRQVAYTSQCLGRVDRAHRGKSKINSRLCSIGSFNPDEWDFPPKPKWMRRRTYSRAEEKFDHYDIVLDQEFRKAAARLIGHGWPP